MNIGPILQAYLLMDHPSVVVAVLQKDPKVYASLDEHQRANVTFALAAVEKDWSLVANVPYATRNNLEIQMAAVSQNRVALHFFVPTDRTRILRALGKA